MSKVDILHVLRPFPTRGGLQMEAQVCKHITRLAFSEIGFACLFCFCLFEDFL